MQANEISQEQKNRSRAILTQIGHMIPVGWKPRARQQFSASKARIYSSRIVTQIEYAPVWLEAQGQTAVQRRQSNPSQQQNSSRAVSNQIGYAPVRLEAATTESREVRVSDTSHLIRPTEIQNSLALAKPAVDRAIPCRKSEISQQQNGGVVVSNPNRACTRSIGSPGPDSSSVQEKRDFAGAEEQ